MQETIKLFKRIIFVPGSKIVRSVVPVFLLAVVIGLVLVESDRTSVKIVGPEEIVFNWSDDACEPEDIPDLPARAFRDAEGRVQLIASHYVNYRMIGLELDTLEQDCTVVMESHYEPDPSRFADREWISSIYTLDGKTIYALIHNEYQGHTHPGRCLSGEYFECWYNSVTLAVSTDGGDSYVHAPPPSQLVASIPYRYKPDAGRAGVFSPSNVVHNPRDGYYYVLFHTERYRAQAWGTSVMRTQDLADPGSWWAWDGRGFNVRFINPYLNPDALPHNHVARPVSIRRIQGMSSSVTFNTYFNRFLLVGTAHGYDPERRARVTGIFYSLSDDLIHWTQRKFVMEARHHATHQPGDPDPIAYPSLLDPGSPSRNFETTGKRAYLYFTRFDFSSGEHPLDRDLVRVPVEFSK